MYIRILAHMFCSASVSTAVDRVPEEVADSPTNSGYQGTGTSLGYLLRYTPQLPHGATI